MVKRNFLFNVSSKVKFDDNSIEWIDELVEAPNETEAEKIAKEFLLDRKNFLIKEIMWQELKASRRYLSR